MSDEPSDEDLRNEAARLFLCKPEAPLVSAYVEGFSAGRAEVTALKARIAELETTLADARDEIRDRKLRVSELEANVDMRCARIASLEYGQVNAAVEMPRQKPGESEQVVQTPREFLDAVEKRFGLLDWDLAATRENSVCGPTRCYTEHTDSLKADWEFDASGPLWLNPPFGKVPTAPKGIANWVKKASETVKNRVLVLVPASVGAKWFKLYVHNKCLVLSLSPRLTFVGHESCYPKDLMLCCYNVGEIGFKVWDWKQ